MKKFPNYKQPNEKDCGPTCLKIISKYYGKNVSLQSLRELSNTSREGSSLQNVSEAAEKIGFRTIGVKINIKTLTEVPLPCVLYWNKNHYVVLYRITKNSFEISDPAHGLISYSKNDFIKSWIGNPRESNEGISLLFETTPNFKANSDFDEDNSKLGIKFLLPYIVKYKKYLYQLGIGLFAGSILQLIVPFLTQSIVDVGIREKDINFIYLILIAQVSLFIGRSSIEIIRSWILLHLSTRINISLVSDFFVKLMKLPISYFDVRMTGDILQRINDHKRIEDILTTSSISTLFQAMTFFIFSLVLLYYNFYIFLIFIIGSALYFLWVSFFLKKRKELDYKLFSQVSNEQSKIIELINGMQEIKLHNAERKKRWGWENIQAKLFYISIKNLSLEQYQNVGASLINELKNITITAFSAKLVIDGKITLGMMVSITYIIGQLNVPIQQFIIFIRQYQDAKISLERLSEIYHKKNEDDNQSYSSGASLNKDIEIKNLNFRYPGSAEAILKDITFTIPYKKVTAIVGSSGSGKTTLMKILLKFYSPNAGEILLGDLNLEKVSNQEWRRNCGVVMQEGFIFNDSIANNIVIDDDEINYEKLKDALILANIYKYVESLPLGANTEIGNEGRGLSTGQKQRILIARAIYKNPDLLFFDEATSALDASNEKIIMKNLDDFTKTKTVLVIAHRLSTVKKADQIIVLDNGEISELGTHESLVKQRGKYFALVKNQLELGN